jgi:hypothetical protein
MLLCVWILKFGIVVSFFYTGKFNRKTHSKETLPINQKRVTV